MRRRDFLGATGVWTLAAGAGGGLARAESGAAATVRPKRLRKGDRVGLVAPASANFKSVDVEIAQDVVRAFSLEPRLGAHVRDRHGYLAGRDEARAADVNAFFADSSIAGIFAIRGGWGCARILPHLDWDRIRRNPKVVAGYSDLTALHCGLHARTGLVTFHAPTLLSDWPAFSVDHFRRVVFEAETPTMSNPKGEEDRLVQRHFRTRTITPGRARGRLLGGNLTVLTALVGSPYLPAFDGAILFLEDVDEDIYRVDLERIWRRSWLFAGHACQVPQPGDYFTFDVGTDPLIVIRGDDGAVRCLHNVCRHRGTVICDAPAGRAGKLVCPYHQWVYGRDGSLLACRGMQEDLERSTLGLKPVRTEVVGGLCLLLGLATPITMVPLVVTMIVALLTSDIGGLRSLWLSSAACRPRHGSREPASTRAHGGRIGTPSRPSMAARRRRLASPTTASSSRSRTRRAPTS